MNDQPENTGGAEVVLLIHGLGGTRHDLGRLESRIAAMGIPTADLMLPGHGSHPHHLRDISLDAWLDAVRQKLAALRQRYQTVHVMGMCMGALLALEAAKLGGLGRNGRDRLILLAPPLFLDGWSLPWYRSVRYLLYRIPLLARYLRINERSPYGVKNKRLRTVLEQKFSRGNSRHYAWVPLSTIRELDRLRVSAMQDLECVQCSTLIIHAVDDELTSLKSAQYIRHRVNREQTKPKVRLAVLADSYHMICIDNEHEEVARQVTAFLATA
ncbi:esterase/lipase [Paraburkholderia sp. BL6669N2]|uniref:alpha/beta hydrolase n=1 Tax=Paraburkholderia sp. BL6669N2 TaxID=1938807 RepID=UPI000E236290|nr:alpha/beta fold hydrolase [Paraburkholderia sp. BL6669N2]REG48656.1 esterase/lipase [Paraburkholderia sp. BL6669N2]